MTVFAGILAANASNADEQLQKYMEHFCKTQDFAAICIHRADNSIVSYGEHPHHLVALPSFDVEAQRLPYVSPVYSVGDFAEEKYVYQAVPIVRNGKTEGILYGYITLDRFADYIVSAGYDGKSQFYIVDGASGDFLLDTWHEGALGNLFSEEMDGRETKDGYRAEDMRNGVIGGKTGYFVFRSKTSGEWFYTYYMPLGVNTWSMQMTIDEPTAFDAYRKVSVVMFALFASIIVKCPPKSRHESCGQKGNS